VVCVGCFLKEGNHHLHAAAVAIRIACFLSFPVQAVESKLMLYERKFAWYNEEYVIC
jgi:hypothetical protein